MKPHLVFENPKLIEKNSFNSDGETIRYFLFIDSLDFTVTFSKYRLWNIAFVLFDDTGKCIMQCTPHEVMILDKTSSEKSRVLTKNCKK